GRSRIARSGRSRCGGRRDDQPASGGRGLYASWRRPGGSSSHGGSRGRRLSGGCRPAPQTEGMQAYETHVWYGPAAAMIVEAATAQKADLIVMSTHGRSGLRRLIIGSVTESVLRGTTIP